MSNTPVILALCRLLQARPQGVSLGEVYRRLDVSWVDKALGVLIRAGVVEATDGVLYPRPGLGKLAQGLELVFIQVGEAERTKALVEMVSQFLHLGKIKAQGR